MTTPTRRWTGSPTEGRIASATWRHIDKETWRHENNRLGQPQEGRWLTHAAATAGTTPGDLVRTILRDAMRLDYARHIASPVQALAVAYREAQERIECAQGVGA